MGVGGVGSGDAGATGEFDQKAADGIRRLGMKIAGFSVNVAEGTTLGATAIPEPLPHVRGGCLRPS
jgi:hypothetical protein